MRVGRAPSCYSVPGESILPSSILQAMSSLAIIFPPLAPHYQSLLFTSLLPSFSSSSVYSLPRPALLVSLSPRHAHHYVQGAGVGGRGRRASSAVSNPTIHSHFSSVVHIGDGGLCRCVQGSCGGRPEAPHALPTPSTSLHLDTVEYDMNKVSYVRWEVRIMKLINLA